MCHGRMAIKKIKRGLPKRKTREVATNALFKENVGKTKKYKEWSTI